MQSIEKFDDQHEFLSNFHACPIEYEGIVYPTTEHAFQAAKSLDDTERRKVAAAKTPGTAKRMGKMVQLRPHWDIIKTKVMEDILRIKFAKPHLRELLKATGDAQLIEGNTWNDRFWGVYRGQGQNWLGKILMKIRGELT